jgi:hypothetical protein
MPLPPHYPRNPGNFATSGQPLGDFDKLEGNIASSGRHRPMAVSPTPTISRPSHRRRMKPKPKIPVPPCLKPIPYATLLG